MIITLSGQKHNLRFGRVHMPSQIPNKRLSEHKFHKSAFVEYQAGTRALRKPEAGYSIRERSQSSRTHVQVVVLQRLAFWKTESHLTSKLEVS